MRKVGTFTLTVLLVFGLLGIGLSACRGFMDIECVTQMAGTSEGADHCKKMCQFGRDESPAVLEKAQPEFSSNTLAVLALDWVLLPNPDLLLNQTEARLEVYARLSKGEVYLLNASFLI
ncbi:hypothetical protein MYX82_06965 [Acidobacteria bacterium AH-259-D05]|nr:hypothetical protein [Acidobacteria bacterium AH-259-D05]